MFKDLQDWWTRWSLPFMGIVALLFFVMLALFYPRISRWLNTRSEIQFFKPTWEKSYGTLSNGAKPSWFGSGKYENECRRILENIFNRPFSKQRPAFLKRPSTGKNLELDGYNPDLKLAFEYNGAQHAKFHPMHRGSIQAFKDQQDRDRLKAQLCQQHGVKLIVIPHTVKWNKLEEYIRTELRKVGAI